ncbi:MAG: DMT family transporter [Thermoleophilaceae bacterium]|nr:DMT family transporter [Thermoleophilaceae bacterium]
MDRGGVAVGLTVLAGGMIALQAPINGMLGKTVGSFTAATISFVIGTIALIGITVVTGVGDVGEAKTLPWYYLIGGVLGAIYVTTALVAVQTLGAGGVTAATITGQLTASVVVDRYGLLGLDERPLTWQRVLGVALLAAGVFLVVRD